MRGNLEHKSYKVIEPNSYVDFGVDGSMKLEDLKGVRYDKKRDRYRGVIDHEGKRYFSPRYATAREASDWYKDKLQKALAGEPIKC